MRPGDREFADQLERKLLEFSENGRSLPGIQDERTRKVFLEQLIESCRRVKYVSVLREKIISEQTLDPSKDSYDPIKAAIIHNRMGRLDEAFWQVFLFTHFGKHRTSKWQLVKNVYGRLGGDNIWSWERVSDDPSAFTTWLNNHATEIKPDGQAIGFGSHRPYISFKTTGKVVTSYVEWIQPPRTHKELMNQELEKANGNPHKAFDKLYKSMSEVSSFGRLAKFDYLAMVGKLNLAPIKPGSPYLTYSTGPLKGAKLLFSGQRNATIKPKSLDSWLVELDQELDVGMQVLEDALCNWNKSPTKFVPFRG